MTRDIIYHTNLDGATDWTIDSSAVEMSSEQPAAQDAGLPRLGRTRLREQVASVLEAKILDGTFGPSTRLPTEAELTDSFGVSRTIVRDAVRLLEARGLVDIRRGSGTVVKPASTGAYSSAVATMLLRSDLTIGEVFSARAALEGQLAMIACKNHTAVHIQQIGEALERLEAAVNASADTSAIARLHVAFHTEMIRATNLRALEMLLGPIQQMMLATSVVAHGDDPRDPRSWRVPVHRALLDALATRDPEAVAAANERHWATPLRSERYRRIRDMRVGEMSVSPGELVAIPGGRSSSND